MKKIYWIVLMILLVPACIEAPSESNQVAPNNDNNSNNANNTNNSNNLNNTNNSNNLNNTNNSNNVNNTNNVNNQMCDPACSGATVCDEGTCVGCASADDCTNGVCVGGACVACVDDQDCPADAPVCAGEGAEASCVECDANDASWCTNNNKVCDGSINTCVECLGDTDCITAAKAKCDTQTNTCVRCDSSAQCEGIGTTKICNQTTSTCVECLPSFEEADCGANACNPQTFECTSIGRDSLVACAPCNASSECNGNAQCIEMSFGNNNMEVIGTYCANVKPMVGESCRKPFASLLSNATTTEGTTVDVCTVNTSVTTCVAYTDYSKATACGGDDECGVMSVTDGLCVGGKCTIPCNRMGDCHGDCVSSSNISSCTLP